MKSRRTPACLSRSGVSAVELALALPLLMLITLGCVDFGRVMYYSIALENANRTGCDYAATHRFTDHTVATWRTRVGDRVADEMLGVPNFESASLHVTIESEHGPDGVLVTLAATYPFRTVVDWPGLPNSLALRHRVSAWQYR